jgi:hypothetical protein
LPISQVRENENFSVNVEIQLCDLGYSYRESLLIRNNLIRKYVRHYKQMFHCDRQTKTELKKQLPDMYHRIMISRYKRLHEFLSEDVGTKTGTHSS